MFYYLYCKIPCAVKVNGDYVGIASKNLKYFEKDNCFLELIPLDPTYAAFTIFLDKNTAKNCPNGQIIDLYGGFLIIPNFLKRCYNDFQAIGKKTFSLSSPVTVFCYNQGGVKLVVSKSNDFLVESIPFVPEDIRFETCLFSGKEYLLIICVGMRTLLLAFSVEDKTTKVFKNLCDGYGYEKNKLFTIENRQDILRHTLSCTWEFSTEIKLKKFTITAKRQPFSLPLKLIPYAFFEEVLIDGEIANFFSPRLKPKAEEVRSFLGDFKEILPPFHFVDENAVTLLYDNKVEYTKTELLNGLIDNITIL